MPDSTIPYSRFFEEIETDGNLILNENDHVILSHLETIFTRRIHETFSSDYKFTAAVAQQLTKKYPQSDDLRIDGDGLVALRYPTVFDLAGSYNTVMHPEFALRKLQLIHVCEFVVTAVENGQLEIEVLDNVKAFNGDSLIWSGKPVYIPAPTDTNGAVKFRWSGDTWEVLVNTDPLSQVIIHEFLNE